MSVEAKKAEQVDRQVEKAINGVFRSHRPCVGARQRRRLDLFVCGALLAQS